MYSREGRLVHDIYSCTFRPPPALMSLIRVISRAEPLRVLREKNVSLSFRVMRPERTGRVVTHGD